MSHLALYIFGSSAIGLTLEALSSAKKQQMLRALFFALLSIACAVTFGIGLTSHLPPKALAYFLSR